MSRKKRPITWDSNNEEDDEEKEYLYLTDTCHRVFILQKNAKGTTYKLVRQYNTTKSNGEFKKKMLKFQKIPGEEKEEKKVLFQWGKTNKDPRDVKWKPASVQMWKSPLGDDYIRLQIVVDEKNDWWWYRRSTLRSENGKSRKSSYALAEDLKKLFPDRFQKCINDVNEFQKKFMENALSFHKTKTKLRAKVHVEPTEGRQAGKHQDLILTWHPKEQQFVSWKWKNKPNDEEKVVRHNKKTKQVTIIARDSKDIENITSVWFEPVVENSLHNPIFVIQINDKNQWVKSWVPKKNNVGSIKTTSEYAEAEKFRVWTTDTFLAHILPRTNRTVSESFIIETPDRRTQIKKKDSRRSKKKSKAKKKKKTREEGSKQG